MRAYIVSDTLWGFSNAGMLRTAHTTFYSDLCFASCIHRYYKLKMGCMCMMLWVQMVALECSRTPVSKVSIP